MSPMRIERARRIGLALHTTGMHEQIMHGVLEFARPYRDWTMIRSWPALAQMRELLNWDIHGVIGQVTDRDVINAIRARGVVIVNTSNARPVEDVTTVKQDDLLVGQLAADHLRGLGCRHFAFAGQLMSMHWVEERRAGFLRRLGEIGCAQAFSELVDLAPESLVSSRATITALGKWLTELPKPVGVLCSTDLLAYHLHRACRDLQIDLAREVRLLGVDNETAYCEGASPPFSSIQPGNVGFRAAEALERVMNGERVPKVIRIPPRRVIVRGAALDDPILPGEVQAALQYISSHLGTAVQVDDVLRHVPMSRRALELRFKRATGRTIYQEIQKQRLEHACMLLETTRWPIERIARASGFSDACQFSHVFRQHRAMSPRAHRKQSDTDPNPLI